MVVYYDETAVRLDYSIKYFITDTAMGPLNRVCFFHSFGVVLASNGPNYSET